MISFCKQIHQDTLQQAREKSNDSRSFFNVTVVERLITRQENSKYNKGKNRR